MKDYNNYNLEDFLLDDDFRGLVQQSKNEDEKIWYEFSTSHPEKKAVMEQARELILTWDSHTSALSETELEEGINRILNHPQKFKERKSEFPNWRWWSVAAAVVLIIGLGFGILHRRVKTSLSYTYTGIVSENAASLREVVNKKLKPLHIKLPDGSTVKLSAKSRISYAEQFVKNKKREIFLSGEAFFEVQKDAQNPFFVYANGLVTRVVGTSFLIKTSDTNVEVLVRSGRVLVIAMKDIDSQERRNTELLLTPNQQALFSTKDNIISKSIIDVPLAIHKEDLEPDFIFENQPVVKVFSVLEKVYGIPIVYDNAVMQNCSLRVALSNEPFFTKLDIISKTIGADYRVSDGQVIISGEGCQ